MRERERHSVWINSGLGWSHLGCQEDPPPRAKSFVCWVVSPLWRGLRNTHDFVLQTAVLVRGWGCVGWHLQSYGRIDGKNVGSDILSFHMSVVWTIFWVAAEHPNSLPSADYLSAGSSRFVRFTQKRPPDTAVIHRQSKKADYSDLFPHLPFQWCHCWRRGKLMSRFRTPRKLTPGLTGYF